MINRLNTIATGLCGLGSPAVERGPRSGCEVKPLTRSTLQEAARMAEACFPYASSERPTAGFEYALTRFTGTDRHPRPRYWLARDPSTKRVIGTVGLYTSHGDESEKRNVFWLGWFCVAPEHRGRGVGSDLLDFAVERARVEGKKILRLYTSSAPSEVRAQELYVKRGFLETGREPGSTPGAPDTIYRERVL